MISGYYILGLGVPYFNIFLLKGTILKDNFLLFAPWLLKSPVLGSPIFIFKPYTPSPPQGNRQNGSFSERMKECGDHSLKVYIMQKLEIITYSS